MAGSSKVSEDRNILEAAHQRGGLAVPAAFIRLSGPGWLQSAITLGGGSLTGALFLGALGGTHMLWLQLIAIVMGVIMLSAISYVTLSTGKRPFQAINTYINPVLGCGWLLATSTANMIWCMPQFSLSYDALDKNLTGGLGSGMTSKLYVSAGLFAAALVLVILNERRGLATLIFDWFLKALVGSIVICFFGVVVYLGLYHGLDWQSVLGGFIPNLNQWNQPTGTLADILQEVPEAYRGFWTGAIVSQQRDVMIGAAATAVGINMTFLLPYSMLARGWDKPFRGLARFDLSTGMAIPYIVVTSCVVIAAAFSFHGKVDEAFLSSDPAVMKTSPTYNGAMGVLLPRALEQMRIDADKSASPEQFSQWKSEQSEADQSLDTVELRYRFATSLGTAAWGKMTNEEKAQFFGDLPAAEKRLASTLVKRDAFQLSQSLSPLLGERVANLMFGLGVLGMGFSSIIILMLINGYVFRELAPARFEKSAHLLGCVVAGLSGAAWPLIWKGESQFWLAILTSTFGMMLLPIAYITFFFMMNSRELLGAEMPRGISRTVWNVLMALCVLGALLAAASAMLQKMADPIAGPTVIGIAVFFALMVVVGFSARPQSGIAGDEP
jgi:Mn2+/Fe2+ NRAMP family transporter